MTTSHLNEMEDEENEVELTQVTTADTAAVDTGTSSTQSAAPVSTVTVQCAVCSLDVTHWSIFERARHMNDCLDASTLSVQYDCPTCGKQLTEYNEERRMAHVNLCIDRLATQADASDSNLPSATVTQSSLQEETKASTATADAYLCKICGINISDKDLNGKIRHVKRCGQRFGVRPSDLETVLSTANEEKTGEEAFASIYSVGVDSTKTVVAQDLQQNSDGVVNAFTHMMQAASIPSISTRVGNVMSNAFDVLMKSSKTQTVLTAAVPPPSTARLTPNAAQLSNNKKRRLGGAGSTSARSYRRHSCPDFKRIRGTSPPFIVDGFTYASKTLSSIYFLTHFHSDHYVGLQKSFDCGIIYCNQVTASLVVQELGIDSKYVHPLPMNTPVMVQDVQVTFMDANHCPGAAIILFRLKNGQAYLHTGDFRFHRKMLEYAPLQSYLSQSSSSSTISATNTSSCRLDGVYLDTTYADPKYTFPTQQVAIDHALSLMEKYIMQDKVLFLFGSYSIGKERLFLEIANKFDRKVCVSKAKLKIISTFGWPPEQMRLLTTEDSVTNLHVVPMNDLKLEHLQTLLQKHRLRFHQIVAFRPTGWTFNKSSTQSISTCRTDPTGKIKVYGIPYSEHSSFAELCEFVQATNPHTIIPTVLYFIYDGGYEILAGSYFQNALRCDFQPSVERYPDGMSTRGYSGNAQVLSFDTNEPSVSQEQKSRPTTSSGRSKQPKISEFRQYLEQEELPLAIETKHGLRRVTWTVNIEQMDFSHFLPICLGGLQETLEPYPSFAFEAAIQLLENGRKDTRVLRTLPQVMNQIKTALSTREKAVVHRVLLILQQLTVCEGVGEALTDYYRAILPLCNILQDKHLGTGDDATKEMVTEALETMEAYGKDDAHIMIQQYVPSFQSCV